MIIRKAEEQDIESLLDMYDRLYDILQGEYGYPFKLSRQENQEVLSVRMHSKLCNIIVAEENSLLVGFVHTSISKIDRRFTFNNQKLIGRIDDIYVSEDVRGSGVAQNLLDKAEEWLRKNEIEVIESYIIERNERSLRFHQKGGFEVLSLRTYKTL